MRINSCFKRNAEKLYEGLVDGEEWYLVETYVCQLSDCMNIKTRDFQ